jgi:ribokinase
MHSLRINRSPEIVIVGSANEDLVVRAARLPRPGETVLGGGLGEFFGGKGANQAVAAHRAGGGLGVAFVGKLGLDGRGDKYADYLEAEGLDVSMLGRAKDSPTGVALIVVGPDGENLITVAPGANAHLSPADIEKAKDAIRGARVVLAQLEVPLETVEAAFRIAARAGVRTLLNPAPAPEKPPKGLLARTDVIIPNRSEAEALTGVAIPSVEAAGAACAALRDAGAGSVVTTLGEEGAVFSGPDGVGHQSPPGVDAADTTGAGDAFCGALAARLAEGRPLSDAVRFACAAGALACTVRGAQPSLPAGDRIESLAARMG